MKFYEDIFINKKDDKRYLLCLLLHILKFALEIQVDIETNKGQSCNFSIKGSVCLILLIF